MSTVRRVRGVVELTAGQLAVLKLIGRVTRA